MTKCRPAFRRIAVPACLVLLAACGESDGGGGGVDVPSYAGPIPGAPGADVAMAPEETPDPSGGAVEPPATDGAGPASSEGAPPVGELDPSGGVTPGAGTASGNETPPAGTDPNTGGTETEPDPDPSGDPGTEVEPAPAARTQVFLLFGQSNMYGVPAPQAQDLAITEGAEVLSIEACGRHAANQWVPAQPPLHGCVGQPSNSDFGPGLGPGDYFAKVVTEAFSEDTILLVPNAVPSVSIDVFQPGQQNYNSMVARARMAQERGEIRGILFHQGETNTGDSMWVGKVAQTVASLRSDLGLGEGVPFIAAELPYDGCCGSGHNPLVNQLPNSIPNTRIVSAQGLSTYPEPSGSLAGQRLHFDVASQRELGRRYAAAFLQTVAD